MISTRFQIRLHPAYDRGSGGLDRRHVLSVNYIYNIPGFEHSSNMAARLALAGWTFSGVTVAQAGVPVIIHYTGTDTLGLGGGTTNRPNLVAPVSYPKKRLAWFSTSSFGNPTAPWNGGPNQGFGSAGKDVVVGPGLFNFNWSLFKNIPFKVGRARACSCGSNTSTSFNHTQFQNLDANSADGKLRTGHLCLRCSHPAAWGQVPILSLSVIT